MSLANEPGKLDQYLAIPGLTALELDVKDETGKVGFLMPATTLARRVGASQPYYKAAVVGRKARAAGVYLIGRIVVFEDPTLTAARPGLAIQHSDGSVWVNNAGLGWANPYDKRVWRYVVGIGQAAARAGFDEIQFDYVRFPTDGPIESAVFPHKASEPMGWTIARFAHYASSRLHPLGVRVSVDVFGLSATHDLGIGQVPGTAGEVRRRGLPDGLPVALQLGGVQPARPERGAGTDGRPLAPRLPERDARPQGAADSLARGLLAHERTSGPGRRRGADQSGAPFAGKGLPPLEPGGGLHGASPQVVSGRKRLLWRHLK